MANTHYRLENLTENKRYQYIHFDDDGDMILTVPVVGGGYVSTDNTCKSSLLQDSFFGMNQSHTSSQHPTALQVLNQLKETLQFDLAVLHSIGAPKGTIQHKQNKLSQTKNYIDDLQLYSNSSRFRRYYAGGRWHMLTQTARNLIRRHTNAHGMLLSPQDIHAGPDSQVRFGTTGSQGATTVVRGAYTTSYARPHVKNYGSYGTRNLRGSDVVLSSYLSRAFASLGRRDFTKKGSTDARESIINNTIAALGEGFETDFETNEATKFPQLISALENAFSNEVRSRCENIETPTFTASKYNNQKINYNTLKNLLCFDSFEDFIPQEESGIKGIIKNVMNMTRFRNSNRTEKSALHGLIDNVLNMTTDDSLWRQLNQGSAVDVFYDKTVYNDQGILNTAVQFYFATANIFANSHQLSNMDFGQALETRQRDSQTAQYWHDVIPGIVITALSNGEAVDIALMNFINRNYRAFGLRRPFNQEEINTINRRFNITFNMIKDTNQMSAHVDEFLTFVDDVPGDFVIQDNAVSYPFAQIMEHEKTHTSPQEDLYKRIIGKISQERFFTPGNIIPADKTVPNLEIDLTSENIRTLLAQLSLTKISRYGKINPLPAQQFAHLLMSGTESGDRLFQVLSAEDRQAIVQSSHWLIIREAFYQAQYQTRNASVGRQFHAQFDSLPITRAQQDKQRLYLQESQNLKALESMYLHQRREHRGETNSPFGNKPNRVVRFFKAIYFFFYEIFHWCKQLNFSKLSNVRDRLAANALVAKLCSPQKTLQALNNASNCPTLNRSEDGRRLSIQFDSAHGGDNSYQKSKNLGYTLKRAGISGVRIHHRNDGDSVVIHGAINQNRFFQKLLDCGTSAAADQLEQFEPPSTR